MPEELFRIFAKSFTNFDCSSVRKPTSSVFVCRKHRLSNPGFLCKLFLREAMLKAISPQQVTRCGLPPEIRLESIDRSLFISNPVIIKH